MSFLFFAFILCLSFCLFVLLATPCSMQGLISLTRDGTLALGSESAES